MCEGVDRAGLVQNIDRRRAFVKTVTNLPSPYMVGSDLTFWATVILSKNAFGGQAFVSNSTSVLLCSTLPSKWPISGDRDGHSRQPVKTIEFSLRESSRP